MTFEEICIKDGGLTDAGERACALVYESITGECWHTGGEWKDDTFHCAKCKCSLRHDFTNRRLASSLDAWAEHIWPVILENGLWREYEHEIYLIYERDFIIPFCGVCDKANGNWKTDFSGSPLQAGKCNALHTGAISFVRTPPIHHLEAALRACGKYDEWVTTNG